MNLHLTLKLQLTPRMQTKKGRWINRVFNILFVVPGYESYLNTVYVVVHLNVLNVFNEVVHKRSFPAF